MADTLAGYTYIFQERTGPRTLLLLHGTGGDELDLLPLCEALDANAHILSVRGNVSENGMNRYFKRLAQGVFDREDLARRSEELTTFIQIAAERHSFELSETVGVGFSNGANILLHIVCTHPHLLKAAVLLRPMSAALPDAVRNPGIPMYIGAGKRDEMVPQGDAQHIASALQNLGADVTVQSTDNDHGLGADDVRLAKEWLAKIS